MPTLKIDIREQDKYISELREKMPALGFEVEVGMYDVADYFCGNQVGVEHKTPEDFIGSVRGRLWQQAVELRENFNHAFIVVDGTMEDLLDLVPENQHNSIWAAVNSLNTRYRTPVLFCGKNNLATQLYWLLNKATDEKVIDYTPVRKQAPTKDLQVHLISALPGIGHEKAKRILEEYGSPLRAFNLLQEWSDSIEGVGKKTVEKIHTIISEESQ